MRFEHIHFLEKPCSEPQVISEIKKIFRQDRQQAKVVVVDDDPMLVKMLQSRIQANGFEVSAFTNSEEAIHRLQAEDPDLLVTDIIMPNVSGWMITQEIKRNEDFKNLPVILLSSLIEKEGQAERHEIGDYFMSKPVMMDKLVEKIKELILSQRKG